MRSPRGWEMASAHCYSALNTQNINGCYPLPRIDFLLDWLDEDRSSSKLDLTQGYQQVAMVEDSINITAFCTHPGQWECVFMPFGLCNAPSTFQRLTNRVLEEDINYFIRVIWTTSWYVFIQWGNIGIIRGVRCRNWGGQNCLDDNANANHSNIR